MSASLTRPGTSPDSSGLDVARIRSEFPILERTIHGKPLVYLDNAATTQKPRSVIDAQSGYYEQNNANVHRGVYTLASEATDAYEAARATLATFLGGVEPEQIVFTRSTTESLNLVAYAWARRHLIPGDVVLLSEMEHHSNIVPWQILAKEVGAVVRYIPVTPDGTLCMESFRKLLTEEIRVLSIVHASNVLGTINPVKELVREVKKVAPKALTVVDAAQSVPHMKVDFPAMGCDFLAYSGHKMYGPMGAGVLVGRPERLDEMKPFLGGGEMIESVTFEGTTFARPPHRFEAGTPNVAGAIGLAAAAEFVMDLGMERLREHGRELTAYAIERFRELKELTLYGPLDASKRSTLVTFVDHHIHPHDLATILDQYGIAIRAGHHCAQPLHAKLGIVARARASFGAYNTKEEIDVLVDGIHRARRLFGHGS